MTLVVVLMFTMTTEGCRVMCPGPRTSPSHWTRMSFISCRTTWWRSVKGRNSMSWCWMRNLFHEWYKIFNIFMNAKHTNYKNIQLSAYFIYCGFKNVYFKCAIHNVILHQNDSPWRCIIFIQWIKPSVVIKLNILCKFRECMVNWHFL